MRAIFAIISAFISAKKFNLWVPSECVYELPDASFLCEYFRCVGRLLEDRLFGPADPSDERRLSGKSGSNSDIAKSTRLTRTRHRAPSRKYFTPSFKGCALFGFELAIFAIDRSAPLCF
jgi:hypothetical protein